MPHDELDKGIPLFDAARAAGVTVAGEVEPRDSFAAANWLRLHYLDWGTRGREPMLLLHGGAQQAHMWDFFALAFHTDYHILALDQRGQSQDVHRLEAGQAVPRGEGFLRLHLLPDGGQGLVSEAYGGKTLRCSHSLYVPP